MKEKFEIFVLIAAYNAQKNIGRLLQSVILQEIDKNIRLKIMVYSDMSIDNTVLEAKKVVGKNIVVKEGKKRLGFAGVVKQTITANTSDLLVILNDDITIRDRQFLSKIIHAYQSNTFGLACADIKPLTPSNFIQKANYSSFLAYRNMAKGFKNGNNKFTCDGKVLVISKDLCKRIDFPKDLSEAGNVDSFLFFSCLKAKMKYSFINNTAVYFTFPSSLRDYINWTSRNNSNSLVLEKIFGSIVAKNYKKPKSIYFYMILEFMKNPLGSMFVFLSRPIVKMRTQKIAKNFNPFWETIATTKI